MISLEEQNYKPLAARKFSWLLLGKVFPVLILFLITILYSQKLSFDEYGKFQSLWMYANIISVIISFGISTIILSTPLTILFSILKKNKKKLSVFYSVLWLVSLTMLYLVAKNFNSYLKLLLIAFIVIQNIIAIAETLLVKQHGEKASFIINAVYSILFLGWHLYVLQTHYSLPILIIGIGILSILKLVAIILVPSKKELAEKTMIPNNFLNHWAYLGINDIIGVVSKWMDKFFLLYLLTAADFAIFFNGSFEIPLFGLLVTVTGNFLMIEMSQNLQLTDKVIRLFRGSFTMLSTILFPLFFFLFFFRDELFSLAFNDKYNASLPIFVISIFIIPIRINNYSVVLQCYGKGKTVLLGSLLDIFIAISLMFILYPAMGTRGIALSVVISTFCQAAYYVWQSAKILRIKTIELIPIKQLIFKGVLFGIIFYAASLILQSSGVWIKLSIGALLACIIILAGSWKNVVPIFKSSSK